MALTSYHPAPAPGHDRLRVESTYMRVAAGAHTSAIDESPLASADDRAEAERLLRHIDAAETALDDYEATLYWDRDVSPDHAGAQARYDAACAHYEELLTLRLTLTPSAEQ